MTNKHHEPLFTVFKRSSFSTKKGIILRISVVLGAFIFSMLLCALVIKENIFEIMGTFFSGAVARPWKLILDACLLLGFGIAIVPAFKMKYWNMGANGQVIMGTLIAIVIMFYTEKFALASKFNNFLVILLMLVSSIAVSTLWAVIPAIFKAFFKTNETLFTLMMNYIAAGLVAYVNYALAAGKKEAQDVTILNQGGWMPVVIDNYFIPIVIILLMTVFVYFYMAKTKHGYEVTVVGDSAPTARYVGMHTKTIIIRTLALNGIMCGIIGFLYASAINHSMNPSMCGALGFTAVLIAWLSNFNPLIMGGVSFGLAFLTIGTSKVSSVYRIGNNDLANVIIGLIFFSILISEFFVRYEVKTNFKFLNKFKKNKEVEE